MAVGYGSKGALDSLYDTILLTSRKHTRATPRADSAPDQKRTNVASNC